MYRHHAHPAANSAGRVLLLGLLLALSSLAPAGAGELVFETENDFLTNGQKDDLYTFALAFGWDWGERTLRLRENAFTDREAGLRFDETYLTIGRELPAYRCWTGRAEAGLVRIGHGLFGQSTQNAVHRAIGDPEVDLAYVEDDDLHLHGRFAAERMVPRGDRLASGPVVALEAAPGFRASALLAWRAAWDAPGPFAFQATAGLKWADSDLDALRPWISHHDPYGALEVAFRDRFVFTWSYNTYGTAREHVAIGYRFASRSRRATLPDHRESRERNP